MSVQRPGFPLSFEPVSPTPSDTVVWSSDSESEIDDASRTAKRRKIEHLAREYLEGKPLFIFSATLKGPFDKGWANPWKQTRRLLGEQAVECRDEGASITPTGITIESPRSARSHGPPTLANRCHSDTQVQNSETYQECRDSADEERKASGRPTDATRPASNPLFAPERTSIGSRSSIEKNQGASRYPSTTKWLKKDRTKLDRHATDRPRSPSPTPAPRSVRDISQTTVQNRCSSGHTNTMLGSPTPNATEVRVPGFTPINRHVRNTASSPIAIPVTAASRKKPRKSGAKTNMEPRGAVSPYSKKSTSPRSSGENCNNGDRAVVHMATATTSGKGSTNQEEPFATTDTMPDSFKYHRVARQASKQKRITSKVTKSDFSHGHSSSKANEEKPKKPTPSLMSNTSAGPMLSGPVECQEHISTSVSLNLPSAQVIPDQAAYQNQMISLHSTEYAATNGMLISPARDSLDLWSTQAALPIAQKSLQEDFVNPEIKGQGDQTKYRKSLQRSDTENGVNGQITPFQSFYTPRKRNASDHAHPTTQGPSSTHAIINEIIPYDVSTAKKAQFEHNSPGSNLHSHPQRDDFDGHNKTSSEPHAKPVHPRRQPSIRPASNHSNEAPKASIPYEDFSRESSGTALPFTLPSTNGTRQHDGQGFIAGLGNFDLDQAIADAGSFLQSWELHAEVSFQTNRTVASSTGQPAQSILHTSTTRNT
ncbi:hypothetical protein DIZ76_012507 [Coccidioides immitis]|nr:hypothetical protein DIZ76_012507 [Coccidioides immitis]